MRNISRAGTIIPGALNTNECTAHLDAIILNPTIAVLPDYYKGKVINHDGSFEFTVRTALKDLYNNKCAYCEKITHAPKIDHHRPKGRVVGTTNINRGYYWLCYEWTNLLPSCTDCNSIESKGSKYPINGVRNNTHPLQGNPPATNRAFFVYDIAFNSNELPLLLHPEYSIAENNFDFDKLGKITGSTLKGTITISVLKLDNSDLNGWRRKIYEDFLNEFRSIIRRYFRINNPISENLFEEFIFDWVEKLVGQANNDNLEYTLFRKFLVKKIDYFFLSEIDPVFHQITRNKIANALVRLSN